MSSSSGRGVYVSIFQFTRLLSALALFCGSSFAQQLKVSAPHRSVPPKVEKRIPLEAAVPGSIVAGPWMIGANFKSTIYVKNLVETSAVPVTPVLYLSNGAKFNLAPVQLAPAGITVIDVNAALQNLGIAPYATLSGYVELQYSWPWEPVCATVRNLDALHSLIFDYGARSTKSIQFANQPPPTQGPTPITIEGMWWKQEPNVTAFVTLSNTTVQTMTARLELSDNHGSDFSHDTVTISPHGTKLIELNQLLSAPTSEGGIRVSYSGSENDLLISGGLQDQINGYSASLHFTEPMLLPSTSNVTIAELGLMSGPADPMLAFPAGVVFTPYTVLRNSSPAPITGTPTFWWMAGGTAHSAQLSALTLHAGETRTLDIPEMLTSAGLKNFSGSISLVFDVQGNPGGLLMAGGSVDQKHTYVFGVVPRGIKVSAAKNLSYWSIGYGDDTMVTLWNAADEAQDLIFRLMFTGGHYDFPIHLGPRATQMFNISEIVHSQVPDVEGNIIPVGIAEGSAELMGAQGEVDSMLVAMEAGIYNVKKATCGTYSCETCNGVTNAVVNPGSFTVAVGGTRQLNFIETWNSGQQYSGGDWSSYNPSVATVNSSGLVTGVAPGAVNIHAQDHYYEPTYTAQFCGYYLPSCPVQPAFQPGAQASGSVTPTISGATTVWYFSNLTVSGYATSIQLTASGGSSSTSWNITAGANNITVSSFTGSQITVLSSGTAFSSAVGDTKLTATVNGQTSSPFSITTRTPNSLVKGLISTACDTNLGYITTLNYTIKDQLLALLPNNVPLNENWTTAHFVDYNGTTWQRPDAGFADSTGANFADHVTGEVKGPSTVPNPTCDGNSTPVDHWGQEWRIGSLGTGFGRRVQTDTIQAYIGHAAHLSIITPAP